MNERVSIKTLNLTKAFGDNIAVDNLNLEIKKGELFGLVGPDGAGKTTTMRLLTAITEPTSGEAWVAGHSILKEGERIKEKIGYMSQRFGLYEDLAVMENIIFYADLYEVPQKERPRRIERLLGFSNLTPFKDRLAGKLSGGMKQKLGLACALIHTPEVLFLDEPTSGVEPVSRRDFWRILYDLLKEEVTIFVSTKVKKSLGLPMVEIWSDNARMATDIIREIDGVKNVSIYGERLHITLEKKEIIDEITVRLNSEGLKVIDSREILPSLEDIFISMVEKK
ncbi:MAG: ABC transporter ATP-binding protein [Nitrospirae bacterium]|nr:ABC transporter ATP-binding protein [Nitrospirota bacterium]